jgi:hypothetical protein
VLSFQQGERPSTRVPLKKSMTHAGPREIGRAKPEALSKPIIRRFRPSIDSELEALVAEQDKGDVMNDKEYKTIEEVAGP